MTFPSPPCQQVVDDKHLRRPREENVSFLEVRFPPGGNGGGGPSCYPRAAPLVCFSTPASQFPKSACLNVTKRLMEEARWAGLLIYLGRSYH